MRTRYSALSDLLVSLFTDDELSRFLMRHYREVYVELPTGASLASLADRAVQALDNRGLLNDAFFVALQAARPQRAVEIAGHRRRGERSTPPTASPRRAGLALGLGLAGVALVLVVPPPGADEPLTTPPVDTGPASEGAPPEPTAAMSDEGAICPDGMIPVAPGAAETGQIAPFCLDTLEVSRAAFGLRCPPATPLAGVAGVVLEEAHARCLREGPSEEWGKHPVAWVDPIEAIAHCEAHGHRLPTLEEWRVAALMDLDGRAKETLVDCVNLCDQGCWEVEHNPGEGWFRHRDDYPRSSPVGSYQSECPSPLGLADIHGNAREIVRDGDGFMVCGTGWRSNTYAHLEPSTWCQPQQEFGRQRDVGFRCAHDLKPPTGA